ncbi:hypothetical protein D9758_003979 [Tetrapyrgos nigripes]|uniref:Uncharacterized protein n=1 Tax=Tetrapyrgos nigripes TaxID=182062 RepID=A0A8H5GLS4_9AGAR|nr:hypothetical protein D9758_003979 [Tetrapyrgos nigripes]
MQQYSHMNLAERRDSGLDSSGSTPFQSHVPSINHALGIPAPYSRPHPQDNNYRISPSPSNPAQQSLTFSVSGHSPPLKRKHIDTVTNNASNKRRREPDETQESFDEGGGQGAKHWSDEEKSKLFKWLMGPGQDDHWNSLRATKNSCLRECASEVFGGKKTYQALKGCYERNFNLFKQIYSFETFHNQNGTLGVNPNLSEADSLREYERRLQTARKAGCDVGNITARTIDNWHRNGWYELFYRRWHGDPATTRPTVNHRGVPTSANGTGDDPDGDDDPPMDFPAEPMTIQHNNSTAPPSAHDRSSAPINYVNPQSIQNIPPPISPITTPLTNGIHHAPPPPPPSQTTSNSIGVTSLSSLNSLPPHNSPAASAATTSAMATGSIPPPNLTSSTPISASIPPLPSSATSSSSDQGVVTLTLTQGMISSYLHFLQIQTQTGKMKMEYLRKREEREERESAARQNLERIKLERERAEFEHQKKTSTSKEKTDRAIELLSNHSIDAGVRQAASDFLKRMFATD